MSCKYHKAIFHALLAATLYAINIPFSKLLLTHLSPTMLVAFLYIGAGVGMAVIGAMKRNYNEMPYYAVAPFIGVILSMIILNERPNILFFIALIIMLIGTRLASTKIEE